MEKQIINGIADAFTRMAEDIIERKLAEKIRDSKSPLASVSEFCKMLGVCRATVYNWEADGVITFTKLGGRVFIDTRQRALLPQDQIDREIKEREARKLKKQG